MQRGKNAGWCDLEDCPGAGSEKSRSVEITVASLHQCPVRVSAVAEIETIECGEAATWRDPENRSIACAAIDIGSVEITVRCLYQRSLRNRAVAAAVKIVQRGEAATGCDLEHRSRATRST